MPEVRTCRECCRPLKQLHAPAMLIPADDSGASVQVCLLLQHLAAVEGDAQQANNYAADVGYENLQLVSKVRRLHSRIDLGKLKRKRLREEKRQLKVGTPAPPS